MVSDGVASGLAVMRWFCLDGMIVVALKRKETRDTGLHVLMDPFGVHSSPWWKPAHGTCARDQAASLLRDAERLWRQVHTRDAALVVRLLRLIVEGNVQHVEHEGWAAAFVTFSEVQPDGTALPLELRRDGTLHPEPSLLRELFDDERGRYDAAIDLVTPRLDRQPSGIVHDDGPEPEDG